MAFVVCPQHGGHGAAAVCAHIAEEVAARRPIAEALVPVSAVFDGSKIGPTWLCSACASRFAVPSSGGTLEGVEGLERYWTEIGFTLVCRFCFVDSRTAAG
jgi:hypothetical protein